MKLQEEIARRRTFAIISHPDAGKTTLTEKFLLYGGAIQVAGAVKSNKIRKSATSDFMEIERQRGISVATSVMTFEYSDIFINKLDLEGRDPFDLMDELEKKLNIHVQPLSFPINKGSEFKGVYNLYDQTLQLFSPEKQTIEKDRIEFHDLNDEALDEIIGHRDAEKLREDAHLLSGVYPDFETN